MPRRPSRGSRRFSKGKKDWLWTAFVSDLGTISTTAIGFDIVEGSMWERSGTGRERATLTRIRGWLSVRTLIANAQYNAAIIRLHNGRGTPDPSDASVLVNDDILWTYSTLSTADAVTTQEVDVPVKRKLSSADDIRFVEISDTVNAFSSSYTLRSLLDCI